MAEERPYGIPQTRAQISATLEAKGALLRAMERLPERPDPLAPVRERPLAALLVVFGAGVALGALTGGEGRRRGAAREAEWRAELWERRARRLRKVARARERELRALAPREPDEGRLAERLPDLVSSIVRRVLPSKNG